MKKAFKAAVKRAFAPGPRPTYEPEPYEPEPTPTYTPSPGPDRFIEVDGQTVRVMGLPTLPPLIRTEFAKESEPGVAAECEKAILEEIAEIVKSEGLIAEALYERFNEDED